MRKTKVMKGVLSILLVLTMMMNVLLVNVEAAQVTQTITTYSGETGGDGWTYDDASKTLTLNDLDLDTGGSPAFSTGATKIVLNGTNKVTTTGGLGINESVTISGDGSLTINTSGSFNGLTVNSGKLTMTTSGKGVNGSLTVNDGNVTITSTNGDGADTVTVNSGTLIMTTSGAGVNNTLTVNGGHVEITSTSSVAFNSLEISGGYAEFTATSGIAWNTVNAKGDEDFKYNITTNDGQIKSGTKDDFNSTGSPQNWTSAVFDFNNVTSQTYTVTVTNDGHGTGSANPASATEGTEVTLTANPNDGYTFKEWQVISGDVTITNNKFTMPAENVEIKAIFEKIPTETTYTVTVTDDGNGTVTANKNTAKAGDTVTLTVSPDDGYELDTLTVKGADDAEVTLTQDNTDSTKYTFTMPAKDVNVSAIFKEKQTTYSITYKLYGGQINDTDCATTYTMGVGATLPTNVTRSGYKFRGWSDSYEVFNKVETIGADATGNKTFYAWWDNVTYTVTYHANYGTEDMKHIDTTSGVISYYTLLPCSFAAPEGKEFAGWAYSADSGVGGVISADYIDVTKDTDLYAIWMNRKYNVIIAQSENGTVTSDPKEAIAGATVTLTITPDEGCELDTISATDGNGTTVPLSGEGNTRTFTMPASDVTVSAIFSNPQHTHEWQYQLKDGTTNTIEAVCKNTDGCDGTSGGTLTITAAGGTYDGTTSFDATLTVSDDWIGEEVKAEDIVYTYNQTEAKDYNDTDDLTQAGYYMASITLENTEGESATAYVEYTVAQKPVTITVNLKATSKVYDRTTAAEVDTATVNSIITGDDVQVVPGTANYNSPNVADATKVSFTGWSLTGDDAGNYVLSAQPADVSATITPKSLNTTGITVEISDTVIFEGQPVPTVTVKDGDTPLTKDTDYTVTQTGSNGEITLTITGKGNYKDTAATKPTYLVVTLPDPDKVEPDDKDAIDAYDRYSELNESYKDSDLEKALKELNEALTDYKIIKGNKSSYVKGSNKTLSFTANGYFGKFTGVEVDGKLIDAKYYSAESGSTIITLKNSYLESLKTGKHTIQVNYTDGHTSGEDYFRVTLNNGSPFTGDNMNLMLFGGVAMTSLLCMAAMILFFPRKKGKYQR